MRHQGPQGEIPSNVDAAGARVSYGGTTGRVDADLWFIIGCAEYWKRTNDTSFLHGIFPAAKKAAFLLRAWEFNNRRLLYVPPAGDWADEYIQSGYVLYDQLLYLQAQRSLAALHQAAGDTPPVDYQERIEDLRELIRANYWFQGVGVPPREVYHEVLYEKGHKSARCRCHYWVPFFSPQGYGYRFDAFANVLASLFGVADDSQRERVDDYISELTLDAPQLLPAFHPVIQPIDEDWEHLQMTFSYTFRNNPYEYHNGGLWPMLSGFYAADLAAREKRARARGFLKAINWANSLTMEGAGGSFPEYLHGRDFVPEGTRQQGWSTAAAIIAHQTIEGKLLFGIEG